MNFQNNDAYPQTLDEIVNNYTANYYKLRDTLSAFYESKDSAFRANNYLVIDFTLKDLSGKGFVQFIDINGREVYRLYFSGQRDYLVLGLPNLAPGIYLCRITTENSFIYTSKIIISR